MNLVWPQPGGNQQLLVSPSCEGMQIWKTCFPVLVQCCLHLSGGKGDLSCESVWSKHRCHAVKLTLAVVTAQPVASALWQSSLGLGVGKEIRVSLTVSFCDAIYWEIKHLHYIYWCSLFLACGRRLWADLALWPVSLPGTTGLVGWGEGLCHPLQPCVSNAWNFPCYSLLPLEPQTLGFEKLRAGGSLTAWRASTADFFFRWRPEIELRW